MRHPWRRSLIPWCLLLALPALAVEAEAPRTITVSGEAELKVPPDEVTVMVGVESVDKDLGKAKKENDERIKRIITAARAAGVEDKRIATDSMQLEPRYNDSSYSQPAISGYFVRRSLQLVLRDVSRFDGLLSAVVEAGANVIQSVRFSTTELRKHRDHARELAMKAAQEKAVALTTLAGVKLKRPRSIAEGSSGWWSGYGWFGGRTSSFSQNVTQNIGGNTAPEGTTAPGLLSVSATVSVTYDIE